MELTIEQALQQGVTAHKEGKLQDAERLYRGFLLPIILFDVINDRHSEAGVRCYLMT